MSYAHFIASKRVVAPAAGFESGPLLAPLFPFQAHNVRWALRRGRAALFLDTGLGKTRQYLEWARQVTAHTGRPVLILAPLAVAHQTVREGKRVGIKVSYVREQAEVGHQLIVVTNYERLDRFDAEGFGGVVLDESGILKSYSGVTKRAILAAFERTPFKLACTATPAPNDHLELGNHAEFLGVMSSHQMIARWFINDASTFGTYRLKGHAVEAFWDWVSSWAAMASLPSDMGDFDDSGYVLPPLNTHLHEVDADLADRGDALTLFRMPEMNATSIHAEKRRTAGARAAKAAELVRAEAEESWIIWCETDYEADALVAAIPDALEVRGSDTPEFKEEAASWFCGYGDRPCRGSLSTPRTENAEHSTTPSIAKSGTPRATAKTERSDDSTIESGSNGTATTCAPTSSHAPASAIGSVENGTPQTQSSAPRQRRRSRRTADESQKSGSPSDSVSTDSISPGTGSCSNDRADAAQSVDARRALTATTGAESSGACTSTTAIAQGSFEDCSARPATSGSESSGTTRIGSNAQPPISAPRILISKPKIFGFGLNFQHVARTVFVGATFSFESYYQAIRRNWRFGQERPVDAHVVMASTERPVWDVMARKAAEFETMKREMFEAARRARRVHHDSVEGYVPTVEATLPRWWR